MNNLQIWALITMIAAFFFVIIYVSIDSLDYYLFSKTQRIIYNIIYKTLFTLTAVGFIGFILTLLN